MMILQIVIDGASATRLAAAARETSRSVDDLARSAVEEAALDYYRHRKDDPAKGKPDE